MVMSGAPAALTMQSSQMSPGLTGDENMLKLGKSHAGAQLVGQPLHALATFEQVPTVVSVEEESSIPTTTKHLQWLDVCFCYICKFNIYEQYLPINVLSFSPSSSS